MTEPHRAAPGLAMGEAPPSHLRRARAIARVLDDLIRIPGTSWRIGIDPLVGLVPGVGDWLGWGVGLHLLWSAWRLGAGPGLLLRMSGNLLVDAAVGAVPVLGDLFDLAWKANDLNLSLLEAHVRDPARAEAASRWVLGALVAGTVGVLGVSGWAAVWLLTTVLGWIF